MNNCKDSVESLEEAMQAREGLLLSAMPPEQCWPTIEVHSLLPSNIHLLTGSREMVLTERMQKKKTQNWSAPFRPLKVILNQFPKSDSNVPALCRDPRPGPAGLSPGKSQMISCKSPGIAAVPFSPVCFSIQGRT